MEEKYNELVKTLQDITECPVCLHPLHLETVMCINGHVMCKGCRGDQVVCPTCRKAFADVQQLTFVQQILRAAPRQCRFKPCRVDVRAEADHEKLCSFRPTRCRVPSCGWEGPCLELERHYYSKHWSNCRRLFGLDYCSDKPFSAENTFLGVSLWTNTTLNLDLTWIEIKYDPNNDTTLSLFPVFLENPDSNIITFTFTLESVSLDITYVFKITLDIENEMSWRKKQIIMSSAMVRQFYEKQDSKLKIRKRNAII